MCMFKLMFLYYWPCGIQDLLQSHYFIQRPTELPPQPPTKKAHQAELAVTGIQSSSIHTVKLVDMWLLYLLAT